MRKTQPRAARVVDAARLLEEMLDAVVLSDGIDVAAAAAVTARTAIERNVKCRRWVRGRSRRGGRMARLRAGRSGPQILGAFETVRLRLRRKCCADGWTERRALAVHSVEDERRAVGVQPAFARRIASVWARAPRPARALR